MDKILINRFCDYESRNAELKALLANPMDLTTPEGLLLMRYCSVLHEGLLEYRKDNRIFEEGQLVKLVGTDQIHVVLNANMDDGKIKVCLVGATLEPIYATRQFVSRYMLSFVSLEETRSFVQECHREMMKSLESFAKYMVPDPRPIVVSADDHRLIEPLMQNMDGKRRV